MKETLFREGVPTDVEAIVAFQIAMAWETEKFRLDPETCANGVRAVFDDRTHGRYFVGESGGEVICSLLITYEWSDWRNGVVWWIQSVYVKPEHRRRGVFQSFYRHIQSRVSGDEAVRGLRLYVDKSNLVAQKVYDHLGMDGQHYALYEWLKKS